MGYRLLPVAQAQLDGIWLYVASESGSVEIAKREIDKIEDGFWLLVGNPRADRQRDHDLGANVRSFTIGEYVILYRIEDRGPLILCVARGSRDMKSLLVN